MPTPRLLIFKLRRAGITFPKSLSHWGLFLPHKEGNAQGLLFEVNKDGYLSKTTQIEQIPFNYLEQKEDLRDNVPIPEIEISPASLSKVCHDVTQHRKFHLYKNNCQHWVFEVIANILKSQGVENGEAIFKRIVKQGYKPIGGREKIWAKEQNGGVRDVIHISDNSNPVL